MRRYLLAWFAMLLVAMLNGGLRDFTYGRYLPELLAHQLSTLSGSALLSAVIYLFVRRWPPASARQALSIGLFWMVLTVAFEFLFFHYVGGRSWAELLANYDVPKGRLWPLLLVWVALAQWLFSGCCAGTDRRAVAARLPDVTQAQRMAKVMQLASFLTMPTWTLSAMHSRSSLCLQLDVLQAPMPAISPAWWVCVVPAMKVSQPGWAPSPMVMARAWHLLLPL